LTVASLTLRIAAAATLIGKLEKRCMISNERRWPSHLEVKPKQFDVRHQGMRPAPWVETLASSEVQIERKLFQATLKENPSGRFLRLTEISGEKTNTIIIPTSGLRDFSKVIEEMINTSAKIQPKQAAAATPPEPPNGNVKTEEEINGETPAP
jgi:hypothetical protein